MSTADTACQMDWRTAQTGKNESSAIGFVTSEQCTKENSPVRVLVPAIGSINFQENGSWVSFPIAVMAYQVYTPDEPMGMVIPVVINISDENIPAGFNEPERYLAIEYNITNPTSNSPAIATAKSSNPSAYTIPHAAMAEWVSTGSPTVKVNGVIFVGHPSTLNKFQTP